MNRNVASAAWLFAAALLIIAARPAAAAVTAATLNATTPSYNGKCPATEAFTGAISGTPGTTFQYSFNRYINGVQQVQNVGAGTIPASGNLAVSDSFSIASSSTGVNFDQVWVHNIAGGQADVYSVKASFTVTCVLVLLSTMPPIPVASPPFSSKNQVTQPLFSNATLVLHPGASAMRSKVLLNQGQADFFFGSCSNSQILCVGYDHVLDTGVFGEKKAGIYRSYVMFPKTAPGTNIVKALLGFHQIFNGTDATSFQCYGGIAPALAPWTSNSDFVDGDFGFSAPAQYIGPNGIIDVTSIVKAWAAGKLANNGFVMRGSDESTFIGSSYYCHFLFSPIELKITTASPILKVQ